MTGYLIPTINEMKRQCTRKVNECRDIIYRGHYGMAKLVREDRGWGVYIFEPGSLKADDVYHGIATKREAEYFSLSWLTKGHI